MKQFQPFQFVIFGLSLSFSTMSFGGLQSDIQDEINPSLEKELIAAFENLSEIKALVATKPSRIIDQQEITAVGKTKVVHLYSHCGNTPHCIPSYLVSKQYQKGHLDARGNYRKVVDTKMAIINFDIAGNRMETIRVFSEDDNFTMRHLGNEQILDNDP